MVDRRARYTEAHRNHILVLTMKVSRGKTLPSSSQPGGRMKSVLFTAVHLGDNTGNLRKISFVPAAATFSHTQTSKKEYPSSERDSLE